MLTPYPHQVAGAEFLSPKAAALLADEPRVGKTGATILAADAARHWRILVITTASGRPVWRRAFDEWSTAGRSVEVHYRGDWTLKLMQADVSIVSWGCVGKVQDVVGWDLIILDEGHYAKNHESKRTQIVYGHMVGTARGWGLVDAARAVWVLSGTPIPNHPGDLFPMMRALCPDRLDSECMSHRAFMRRYCVTRMKNVSRWTKIEIVVASRNLDELKARLDGFWLKRTQQDVGIQPPIYEILPIHINATVRKSLADEVPEMDEILDAAETGETRSLEIHLGSLRRMTGYAKAAGVATAVNDEFEGGLDRVVLMCWHRDVMTDLAERLEKHGVVTVSGSTEGEEREQAVEDFNNGKAKVFIGQITACGEAIDLSASSELIFVESSFVPKDMKQAGLRVTNVNQRRQPRVRVAALEGSVDEALQKVLIRKVATNKEVIA